MGIELLPGGKILKDGMELKEYIATIENMDSLEVYLAQKCAASFVVGLEIGTMDSHAPELIPDFAGGEKGYRKWRLQMVGLEKKTRSAAETDGIWSLVAVEFGKKAGRQQPLERFLVGGVTQHV
jgi:hypothetical protein